MNLKMIEDIWLEMGGAAGQFHKTKLSVYHSDKNAYSQMNVNLATQVLSKSVTNMIRSTIKDEEVVLPIRNKVVYNHLENLYEKWDEVVDICNGKNGHHTPENTAERQNNLLSTLDWFSK